jgi:D-glycero-alpha-D-manno-heptose-7-phosphate kinase
MIVTAAAPIRVCDCGGWTDTWFARRGRVVNIAVRPCAEVRVTVLPASPDRPRVTIDARDFGDRYAPAFAPGKWDRHPLLEAAITYVGVPEDLAIDVSIACPVPAGAGTGTSAAVTVALVGALDRLRGGTMDRRDVARAAHAVETKRLGQQSGIQDQIASACGGINDIEMTDYPNAGVRQVRLAQPVEFELERRISLVFIGRGHRSSDIHQRVIAWLSGQGPDCAPLADLRHTAGQAADAMTVGNLDAFGDAMKANTEAQRRLHPDLVCPDADRIIAIARDHSAAGWKVNGAGGDGGSLTLLGPPDAGAMAAMIAAVRAACPGARFVPITLDRDGLRTEVV